MTPEQIKIDALEKEVSLLKAKLWVARDSQLRTYDGLTDKADKYDDAVVEIDKLKSELNQAIYEMDKAKADRDRMIAAEKEKAKSLLSVLKDECYCMGEKSWISGEPIQCLPCEVIAQYHKS